MQALPVSYFPLPHVQSGYAIISVDEDMQQLEFGPEQLGQS